MGYRPAGGGGILSCRAWSLKQRVEAAYRKERGLRRGRRNSRHAADGRCASYSARCVATISVYFHYICISISPASICRWITLSAFPAVSVDRCRYDYPRRADANYQTSSARCAFVPVPDQLVDNAGGTDVPYKRLAQFLNASWTSKPLQEAIPTFTLIKTRKHNGRTLMRIIPCY